LEKSFAGGFIHGLPRLFLDHALIWQPFGRASRRVDRAEDDEIHSSLPSWSWCGWQGYIDPLSFRTGLSYIHDTNGGSRAGSWRTRNLVEWSISIGHEMPDPVLEPRMLDQYINGVYDTNITPPGGWEIHHVSDLASSSEFTNSGPLFTHKEHQNTYFKRPMPIKDMLSKPSLVSTPAYLTCSTTSVSLFPATVLKQIRGSELEFYSMPKTTAFEDTTFQYGPPEETACRILVLQQPNSGFAGLLRLMDDDQIDRTTPLELIAISTGSVNAKDMRDSLEWGVFDTGRQQYHHGSRSRTDLYEPEWINENGKYALLFDLAMAFDKEAAWNGSPKWDIDGALKEVAQLSRKRIAGLASKDPELAKDELFCSQKWFKARFNVRCEKRRKCKRMMKRIHPGKQGPEWDEFVEDMCIGRFSLLNRKAWGDLIDTSSTSEDLIDENEFICEFYNVLWIERRDGIAYRRACGWVPKHIWEAYAKNPVEVKLG
jgi:hypothetical protein